MKRRAHRQNGPAVEKGAIRPTSARPAPIPISTAIGQAAPAVGWSNSSTNGTPTANTNCPTSPTRLSQASMRAPSAT